MSEIRTETKYGAREAYDVDKLATRTGRYLEWLKRRWPNEPRDRAGINEALLGYSTDQERINLDELENDTSLFDMGEEFTFYPRPEYPVGQEPDTAPLTRQQMRLLLVGSLPPEIIPFVMQHFTFRYDGSQADRGPSLTKNAGTGRYDITFYRDNFLNEVIPPGYADSPEKAERAKYLRGFIDPSKVVMVVGKIMSHLIDAPENLDQLLHPDFAVTKAKAKPEKEKGAKKKKKADTVEAERRTKQWEDFVALAIAAPDVAQLRHPQLFAHYKEKLRDFEYAEHDLDKLDKLDKLNRVGEKLALEDFNVAYDLRTEAEKQAAIQAQPQLAWYDHFITLLNRGLVHFGKKIVYQKPDDPVRDAHLADSDKQVKELLLTTNEVTRDVAFGQRLQESTDFHSRDRYETYAYLMAFSQAGEFAEWRIYAWLYKFSKLFRETGGKQISDQDFKDLQTVYRQSEDIGKRFGTQVLPFEATQVIDKAHGRPVFIYHAIDRNKYKAMVQQKVQAKNDRTIQEVNEEAFHRFYIRLPDGRKQAIPFNDRFDPGAPEGLQVSSGNLTEFLGQNLAQAVGAIMHNQGVERIPADAQAVARTLNSVYHLQGRKFSDRWSEESRDLIARFERDLVEVPEEQIKKAMEIDTESVRTTEDAEHILKAVKQVKAAQDLVQQSISVAAKHFRESGAPGTAEEKRLTLALPTQEFFYTLLQRGVTDSGDLILRISKKIAEDIFPTNAELARQEQRNVVAFLADPTVRANLIELDKLYRKQYELEPREVLTIRQGASELVNKDKPQKADEQLAMIMSQDSTLNKEAVAVLDKLDIVKEKELEQIKRDLQIQAEQQAVAQPPPTAPAPGEAEPPVLKPEANPEEIKAKQLEHIRTRLNKQVDAERVIGQLLSQAMTSLRDNYSAPTGPDGRYADLYTQWLDGPGRILRLPALSQINNRLAQAVNLMDSKNETTARDGVAARDQLMISMERTLKYEEKLLEEDRKARSSKVDED